MTAIIAARIGALALGFSLFGGQALAVPADTLGSGSNAVDRHAAVAPTTVKIPGRFEFYRREGLPAPYRGRTNPYQPTVPSVLKGADLYNARCASCHGLMGFGNGQAGGKLNPRPADLAWSLSGPNAKDDFLFWTIAEGGAQFGSNMPAFKKPDLSDGQIWEIITYMRAAFEGREARATTTHDGAPREQLR